MTNESDFPGDRPFPSETAKKKNQVVKATAQTLPADIPAMSTEFLVLAIERGVDVGPIISWMERLDAIRARKEFDSAMASAKAEIQPITKNRTVKYPSKDSGKEGTKYSHEDLAGIAIAIDPILAKNGLSYRWRTSSEINQPIKVTCIIAHRLGHSEETTLCAGADSSGSKNSIQAIGSTVTYLQRYTLKAALGLAAAADDDGNASEEVTLITAKQAAELTKLIIDTGGDVKKFCAFAQVEALSNIYANRYDAAVTAVKNAAAQRKAKQTKGAK